jgi:quinol monooxygenase YgiN
MAKFVQIIEFDTDKIDEMLKLDAEYTKATEGRNTAGHSLVCADKDNPGHYYVIVEFASSDAADKNNALPETQEMSEKMMKVSKNTKFHNLDVLDEQNP